MKTVKARFVKIVLATGTALMLSSCLGFGTQAPAPTVRYGAADGAGSVGVHTVAVGDTLWNISQRYNISMPDLARANNLRAPFALAAGQRLKLPPPQTYRARAGDSLYTVSRLFGVSTTEIARRNDLRAPYRIDAGQVLKLPSIPAPHVAYQVGQSRSYEYASAPAVPSGRIDREVLSTPQRTASAAPSAIMPPQPVARPAPAQNAAAAKPAAIPAAPPRSSGRFGWPVGGRVISSYGPRPGGLHNDGMNIAAARGTPVQAAENGVVVYADNELKGFGNLVLIRHADRWMTAYAHMDTIRTHRGATVKRGDIIGTVGATGGVDTPQLHFEVRRGTEALNPEVYLDRPGS
jgi:murein DD-endopeptidase MepM/ murein hydrolase activator NlpD